MRLAPVQITPEPVAAAIEISEEEILADLLYPGAAETPRG